MKIQHAQPEAFSRMIAGKASRDEAKAIVRHLLAGCGPCIKRSRAAQKEVETPDTWNYDRAFARVEALFEGASPEQPEPRRIYAGQRH
jgi:hypothetical protein